MALTKIAPTAFVLLLTATVLAGGHIARDLIAPDVEGAQEKLFSSFDRLEGPGAYIVGEDDEALGEISRSINAESLANDYDGAGSEYKPKDLFNKYGKYGSDYGPSSAFCSTASHPPLVLTRRDGKLYEIGLLTTNASAVTKGQGINTNLLRAWLGSR